MSQIQRFGLYEEVTSRIIAELEEGRVPWVRPWDSTRCPCMMPRNAVSRRVYSGINILILWCEAVKREFASQRWLTYRQAQQVGGNVRRGEKGTSVMPIALRPGTRPRRRRARIVRGARLLF